MKSPELNIHDIEELKKTKDFWYTFFKQTVQDSIAERVSLAIEKIFSGVPLPEEDVIIIEGYFNDTKIIRTLEASKLPPVIEKIGGIGAFQKLIIEEETTKKIFDIIEKDASAGNAFSRFWTQFGFSDLQEIKPYLDFEEGDIIMSIYMKNEKTLVITSTKETVYEISKNGSIWITPKGQGFASLSKKFLPKKKKNTPE